MKAAPDSSNFDEDWKIYVELEVKKSLTSPSVPDTPFSLKELKHALKLPKEKILNAPGVDEIRNILLIPEMADQLLILSNFVLKYLVRPALWGIVRLLFIPKDYRTL